jgi:hypothetical protein
MKMKNKLYKIKITWLLVIIGCIGFGSCEPKSEEVLNIKTSEFVLKLEVSESNNHLDSRYAFSKGEITVDNVLLENCLSVLLQKDTSFIHFENEKKRNIVLTGQYKNLRENATIEDSYAEFLNHLQKALEFSLTEKFPANTYQLIKYDSVLLRKSLSELSASDSSVVFTANNREEIRFSNADLTQIADGLTKVYPKYSIVLANKEHTGRYTFALKDIPLTDLKKQLETKIGFSIVQVDATNFSGNLIEPIVVVFNE